MQLRITILILFFSVSSVYAQEVQRVIQESGELSEEEKRVIKVEKNIDELKAEYKKAYSAYQKKYYAEGLNPNAFSVNAEKSTLQKKVKENNRTLDLIEASRLQERNAEIRRLYESIGRKSSISSIDQIVNKLNRNLTALNKALKDEIKKEYQEDLDKSIQSKERTDNLNKLNKEIANLDKLLDESKSKIPVKKSKNLDDFIKEKGIQEPKASKTTQNLDDLLTSSSKKKQTSTKNLDDLLSSSSSNSNGSKNIDNLIKKDDIKTADYQIKTENGKQGVVDSRGKILIPFKSWEITEFKYLIAGVKLLIEEEYICSIPIRTYKTGFVDENGGFIDGYEIIVEGTYYSTGSIKTKYYIWNQSIIDSKYKYRPTLDSRRNAEEKKRHDKEVAYHKQQKRLYESELAAGRKKAEIRRKKCTIEINNYKSSQYTKYQ